MTQSSPEYEKAAEAYEDRRDLKDVLEERDIWHQEMESLKGVFKFADPIVPKLYARDVRSNLEKVKTILEA